MPSQLGSCTSWREPDLSCHEYHADGSRFAPCIPEYLHCFCRVHAIEAYAVSDREPALPFRITCAPGSEGPSSTMAALTTDSAHISPLSTPPAERAAAAHVMSLNLDSAAGSIAARTQAQRPAEVTDSAREPSPATPGLSSDTRGPTPVPNEAGSSSRASADAAAPRASPDAEPPGGATPLVASLTDWAPSRSLVPQNAPDTDRAPSGSSVSQQAPYVVRAPSGLLFSENAPDTARSAPSAAWPASADAPVKTFVAARQGSLPVMPDTSSGLQARPTSALSTFMAQHAAQLPVSAPPHGDALLGTSDLSPMVLHVPPAPPEASAGMPTDSDGANLLDADHSRVSNAVLIEGTESEHQPHDPYGIKGAAEARSTGDGAGRAASAGSMCCPADIIAVAEGSVPAEAPSGNPGSRLSPADPTAAVTGSWPAEAPTVGAADAGPHSEVRNQAAARPDVASDEATTLLQGAESSSKAPTPVAGQPAWTLLPANPDGECMVLFWCPCMPSHCIDTCHQRVDQHPMQVKRAWQILIEPVPCLLCTRRCQAIGISWLGTAGVVCASDSICRGHGSYPSMDQLSTMPT